MLSRLVGRRWQEEVEACSVLIGFGYGASEEEEAQQEKQEDKKTKAQEKEVWTRHRTGPRRRKQGKTSLEGLENERPVGMCAATLRSTPRKLNKCHCVVSERVIGG